MHIRVGIAVCTFDTQKKPFSI